MKILQIIIIAICALIGISSTEIASAMTANNTIINPPPYPNSPNLVMHQNLTYPALHPPLPITVETDHQIYSTGDKITISSYIVNPNLGTPLVIKVFNPKNEMVINKLFPPSLNQSYGWTVSTVRFWDFLDSGNYTVLSQYGQVYDTTHFYLNSTLVQYLYSQSPLWQFKNGMPAQDVHCHAGLQLVIKAEDSEPACVKELAATKLTLRGWALGPPPKEPYVNKMSIGIQQSYVVGQPINATVTYSGYYWYIEPEVRIFDANGTQVWFNCPFCYARTEATQSPSYQPFTYQVREYSTNALPVINKTGTYTMTASLENKMAEANFTVTSLGNHISNTNSIRDTSFIKLFLTTNSTLIRQGQAVGVDIWISNTSGNKLTMNYDDNWPWKKLSLYPCVVGMPFGVALLEGNYSLHNLTAAKQLSLYQNGTYNCPMERYDQVNAYAFEPSSDNATLETPAGNFTSEIRYGLSVNGFYGSDNDFQALAGGQYTIVAGDEWGHIALQHFTVSNSTQDVSVASIKMIPPFTPGGPIVQLTLANVGAKPITNIKAVLELYNNYTFDFTNVTPSSPLAPHNYVSNATMLIGGGFQTEAAYPLVISGMEGNIPFAYTMKVQIQG